MGCLVLLGLSPAVTSSPALPAVRPSAATTRTPALRPTVVAKLKRRRAWSRQLAAKAASLALKSREAEARAEAAAPAASDAGLEESQV